MKKILIVSAIVLIGLILRLIFIDKPDGLWNDEYISWSIATVPFFNGFVDAVKSQCHMPFYYLYLKIFMFLFGSSDLVLRLTSVLAGIFAIPVMFYLGREHDKRTGYYCAGFTAISSFLIYFSQEVRLYSVLFLISALAILYTIRFIKNSGKKNLICCVIFNFLILFTHTIGFVFVFFNLLFISLNLKSKKSVYTIWTTLFAGGCLLLPLIIKIFSTKSFSQWWGHFSLSKIGFLFTDYFSPVLTNITNAPDKFFYAPSLALFMLIPTLLALFCIIKSVKNSKLSRQLFFVCAGVIIVLIIASLAGKLVFLTKYSIEIYPILIVLACSGLSLFKNKILRNIILIVYVLFSFGYLVLHPYSAPKMHRAEGHKIVTDILSRMEMKCGDYILFEYYPVERFAKYFDFSCYNIVTINKGNFNEYMSPDVDYKQAYVSGKNLYRELFLADKNEYLHKKLQKEIFDNLQYGQNVVMVLLDSVAFYTPEEIVNIAENSSSYKATPLLYVVFSYLKKEVFNDLAENLIVTRVEKKGNWTLVKFTKLNKR